MVKILINPNAIRIWEFKPVITIKYKDHTIEIGEATVDYPNPYFEACTAPEHFMHKDGECRRCPDKWWCDRGEFIEDDVPAVKINDKIHIMTKIYHNVSVVKPYFEDTFLLVKDQEEGGG